MRDDIRVGRMVRDVRLAKRLTQEQLACRAGLSRQTLCRLEQGEIGGITVRSLRGLSEALGMPSIVNLGWRLPEVDRLRDRMHASLIEEMAGQLANLGWHLSAEHSFSQFGERGSLDLLGWQSEADVGLGVEIKARLWDLQETLAAIDRKHRLLRSIIHAHAGWRPKLVGFVLVVPDLSTHRHLVQRHAATFEASLPDRGREVRRWLESPDRPMRGILFLPISHVEDIGQFSFRRRARVARKASLEVDGNV